jgi:hypothetical protein
MLADAYSNLWEVHTIHSLNEQSISRLTVITFTKRNLDTYTNLLLFYASKWYYKYCIMEQILLQCSLNWIKCFFYFSSSTKITLLITVAARSKAWTVFAHLNARIVGSHPPLGMDVSAGILCCFSPLSASRTVPLWFWMVEWLVTELAWIWKEAVGDAEVIFWLLLEPEQNHGNPSVTVVVVPAEIRIRNTNTYQ